MSGFNLRMSGWGDTNLIFGARENLLGFEGQPVTAGAMSPTLELGDQILIDTWRYRRAAPQKGDVIASCRPNVFSPLVAFAIAPFPNVYQRRRVAEGQRLEDDGVDGREDRRVRADAERERKNHDRSEAGSFSQCPRGIAQVLPERSHNVSLPTCD
jgi:hypothetical protein